MNAGNRIKVFIFSCCLGHRVMLIMSAYLKINKSTKKKEIMVHCCTVARNNMFLNRMNLTFFLPRIYIPFILINVVYSLHFSLRHVFVHLY